MFCKFEIFGRAKDSKHTSPSSKNTLSLFLPPDVEEFLNSLPPAVSSILLKKTRRKHTESSLIAHLCRTALLLQDWKFDQAVVFAGLFHSIYGTDQYDEISVPVKDRLRIANKIGAQAERLAYLFCAMDRTKFLLVSDVYGDVSLHHDGEKYELYDRWERTSISITDQEFKDLWAILLANKVEQHKRENESSRDCQKRELLTMATAGIFPSEAQQACLIQFDSFQKQWRELLTHK
mmetsp:Transcript_40493/g.65677  ORF Transcript_40493/g.65677 Transcript_40493/m.65677 type:complete len:235 (+) Transcript_40493:98-802(+)